MKINVIQIVRDHFETLGSRDGLALADLAAFAGLPVIAGVVTWVWDAQVESVTTILTAVAVLGGFLFAALVFVLEVGLHMGDEAARTGLGAGLRERMGVLREVRANVAYSALLAILGTAYFGAGDILSTPDEAFPVWYVAVGVVLVLHLLMTLVMVIKRLYFLLGTEADDRPFRNTHDTA